MRSLANAFNAAGGGRDTLVFVNNGLTGGDIDKVIHQVAEPARGEGKTVRILSDETELQTVCRNSLRGVSTCYAAAVFYASPTEGKGGIWNYTIRADGALGIKIDTTSTKNDAEIFALPLQHSIDFTIASLNSTVDHSALPQQVMEYPFTSSTQKQRNDNIRIRYMGAIIDILGVTFFIGIVGVTYQLVGMMAAERELGMSQLIESMMPNKRRWQSQFVRLLSNHLAFDIMYLPGWIGMALILRYGVFSKTSIGIHIVFQLLTGLSLSSFSIFGGAFFKKAQLSGISTTIISLLLAVLAQVIGKASTGAVAILSLLFPSMNFVYFILLMARWERKNIGTNMLKAAPENPWTLPGIVLWIFLIIQILVFPILGALVERALYGTASKGRTVAADGMDSPKAVELKGFSKVYRPTWFARRVGPLFGRRKASVVAVHDLNLTVMKGQIMVLLGSNGR